MGWKKTGTVTWVNTHPEIVRNSGKGFWKVQVKKKQFGYQVVGYRADNYQLWINSLEFADDFKNKQQAIKWAHGWMKKHPNGQ